MAEETVAQKLTAEFGIFGASGYGGITTNNRLRKAFEIIDGVDDIRKNLQDAADDGALDKAIGKKLDLSGKELREFEATSAQRTEHINEIVAESADMARAKADVIFSFLQNAHASKTTDDAHGSS